MKCDYCPIKGDSSCLGRTESFSFFCEQAEAGDERHLRHIVARSAIADGQSQDNEYPSLGIQALTAAQAAIAFAASGFKLVDESEMSRRLEICGACEYFDAQQTRCRKCGCYLNFKPRAASQACPIGKW